MFWPISWKIYSRYLGEFDGKDYDQEYFDGDVKYLGLTADKAPVKKSISI
jgi:2-oxoglutarate dehydrogenase E1 component